MVGKGLLAIGCSWSYGNMHPFDGICVYRLYRISVNCNYNPFLRSYMKYLPVGTPQVMNPRLAMRLEGEQKGHHSGAIRNIHLSTPSHAGETFIPSNTGMLVILYNPVLFARKECSRLGDWPFPPMWITSSSQRKVAASNSEWAVDGCFRFIKHHQWEAIWTSY